jgi:hypothetical protein
MAKEKVRHLSAIFASVFAHAGHITKEEAKEISGLADHEFETAYDKHRISPKTSCSMKVKRWINSWNISQKRLISTWRIMAVSCSSRSGA